MMTKVKFASMPTLTSESLPLYQPHPSFPGPDVLINQKLYYAAVMESEARYLKAAAQKYDGNKSMLTAADHQDAEDKAKASAVEERRSFFSRRSVSTGQIEEKHEKNPEPPDFTPLVVIIGLMMFGLAM